MPKPRFTRIVMSRIQPQQAKRALSKAAAKVDKESLASLIEQQQKIEEKLAPSGPLSRFITDIKLMLSLIKDYVAGNYREIPWRSLAAIAGALIYLLNPLDLIPDILGMFGLVDDALVLGTCLSLVEKDLYRYRAWRSVHEQAQ